jgi:hypothetical protein
MTEIQVRADIRAPLADVFEALSDHERFFRGHGIRRCVVTTPGKTERNGLGAVREIDVVGLQFREEVVRFERPTRFDYVVRSVTRGKRRLPMEHEIGWLELSERAGVTEVLWRSRFTMKVPLIGGLLERAMKPRTEKAFGALLKQAKRELESRGASVGAATAG